MFLKIIVISAQLGELVGVLLHEGYDPVQVPALARALLGPPMYKPGVAPDGGTGLQPGQHLLHVGHLVLQAHGRGHRELSQPDLLTVSLIQPIDKVDCPLCFVVV